MNLPLVSVIMPAYNAEAYIEESIISVLKQTYKNIELIVVNDYSTDNTQKVLERIAQKDTRVIILNNLENIGCADSRNRALTIVKGEYVAFCDSDDIWRDNKIEIQLKTCKESDSDMIFTAYEMIDGNGRFIKYRNCPTNILMDDLLKENSVIFSTTFFKRDKIANIKFDKQWYHEDYVFLLECLQNGLIFSGIANCLVNYRVHNNGRSFNKFLSAKYRWKIYREFLAFNIFKSFYYFVCYTINGIKKYK